IHVALKEQYGNSYQAPLEDLLEKLELHATAQRLAKTAGAQFEEGERALAEAIDRAFADLERAHGAFGGELEVTAEGLARRKRDHVDPVTVRREWQTLKSTASSLGAEEITARHRHLLSDVRTLITHVGDTSGLILDPDLDSYYVMDAT